ncbi:unnamed protein product [Amoebophrya sp. A120]|nr:unnamed protein product [Amoebophrya sp. A120]|eukprot:GSA120T00014054001.1
MPKMKAAATAGARSSTATSNKPAAMKKLPTKKSADDGKKKPSKPAAKAKSQKAAKNSKVAPSCSSSSGKIEMAQQRGRGKQTSKSAAGAEGGGGPAASASSSSSSSSSSTSNNKNNLAGNFSVAGAAPAALPRPKIVNTNPTKNERFSLELSVPKWKNQKCATCCTKLGEKTVCLIYFDERSYFEAKQIDEAKKQGKIEKNRKEALERLAKKKELKQNNPAEYERRYKRDFHYQGCPCCEALGIPEPNDDYYGYHGEDNYMCDDASEEETDSLDREEKELDLYGAFDADDYYYVDAGRDKTLLQAKFRSSIHLHARCLANFRKANWWEDKRKFLPTAEKLIAEYEAKKEHVFADPNRLDTALAGEFKKAWGEILNPEIRIGSAKNNNSTTSGGAAGPSSSGSAAAGSTLTAEDRGIFTSAQYKTFQQHQLDLKKKKISELSQMVRQNNVKGLSNVKKELLVESLAMYKTLGGTFKSCPKCRRTEQVDLDWRAGKLTCRGFKVGMTGWRHCEGPEGMKVKQQWTDLTLTPWDNALAGPPQPKAKAAKKNFYNYYGGGGGFGGFGGGYDYEPPEYDDYFF